MQSYSPYRTAILSPEELRAFNQLAPRRMAVDTLRCWAMIVLAWWAVATWPVWWVVALAVPVIGTRFYALSIIGHDGLHRRLFRKAAHSDLWNNLLILGPIGAITRLNRRNHMAHHRDFASPNDPDAYS